MENGMNNLYRRNSEGDTQVNSGRYSGRFARRLLSCEYNMDTACVVLKFMGGDMISIDCTAVENQIADNMYQRSELDYLIYNDPLAYADLILRGEPEEYLKLATEYREIG